MRLQGWADRRWDFLFLVVSILFLGSGSSHAIDCEWEEKVREAEFSPRDTAEGFIYQGEVWLSNGYFHGNELSRDLWKSSDAIHWKIVNSETPYDPYSEMVVYQGKMWAIKGSVWNSTDGVEWERVFSQTPFGVRGYGETVVHRGRIWQLGSGADIWSTTDGIHWKEVRTEAPYGERIAAGVVVHDGKIWLLGGYTPHPNQPPEKGYEEFTTHNDVWCSENGVDWTRVCSPAPWKPRMWFGCCSYGGGIWVLGGYDNGNAVNLGDVWFSPDGKSWERCRSESAFSPRHEPTCLVFRDALWVIAGNSWPVLNDVWRMSSPGE